MDQVRLIDHLAELEVYCESAERYNVKIKEILYKLLSASDKSFEIVVHDKKYDFYLPFTQQEHIEMKSLRLDLIDKIMALATSTGNWDYVLVFASGMDPVDLQCEKIEQSDLYPVLDENGNKVTSLDLNYDSYQVKSNLVQDEESQEYVVQAETLDTE